MLLRTSWRKSSSFACSCSKVTLRTKSVANILKEALPSPSILHSPTTSDYGLGTSFSICLGLQLAFPLWVFSRVSPDSFCVFMLCFGNGKGLKCSYLWVDREKCYSSYRPLSHTVAGCSSEGWRWVRQRRWWGEWLTLSLPVSREWHTDMHFLCKIFF